MVIPRDPLGQVNELVQQGRLPEARDSIGRFLASQPGHAEALHLAGMVELMSGIPDAAVAFLTRCVEAAPAVPFAWSNLGVAYNGTGDFTNALRCFQRALELEPRNAAAMKNQAMALRRLGRHDEAMATFRRALQRDPNDVELNREAGHVLLEAGRAAQALARYDRALLAAPRDAPLHNDRGVALEALGRRDDALAAYTRALEIQPGYVDAIENRAAAQGEKRNFAAALADYTRVEALAPGRRHVAGHLLQAKLGLCDWNGLDELVDRIARGLEAGRPEAQPFSLCYVDVPPSARRTCAALYARDLVGGLAPRARVEVAHRERIRVGYFSADFRDHPVGHLVAPLVEAHDRAGVEVVAFSWGPDTGDDVHGRLRKGFDQFHDVRGLTSDAIAALAREQRIDVAVDLMGHTSGARPAIFARGAAPVQAHYLGYPGTLALPGIDYLVADATVVPEGDRIHYAEKLALLPHTALVAERARSIAATPRRRDLGLPEDAIVFCCFCTRAKITPAGFDAWMRILHSVEGSVLWLAHPGEAAAANLGAEAARRGVEAGRLVFAPRVPTLADHFGRLGAADLFLDTFPYNGHVTTSDALQAGVPAVGWTGRSFAGRVSASLLRAAGLEELVADSPAGYEALAIGFARDRVALRELRGRLSRNRDTQPVFDVPKLARGLESLYARMLERHRAGLGPDHLEG
jgi:protein O-GlcNAc transferase